MQRALFIDADTHVDECEATWQNMEDTHFAPRTIAFEPDQVPPWVGPLGSARSAIGTGYESGYYRYWFIDGQLYVRRFRSDERTGTTAATRELEDIGRRLMDMDEALVDVQVLYPTLFLSEVTPRPEFDVALCHAYNSWIAEQAGHSDGRMRWIAMLPLSSMPDAIEELQFAKEHGTVGIFKRGIECHDRAASDPYFFPLYEEAQAAHLPICFHQANAWRSVEGVLQSVRPPTQFPLLSAFSSLVADEVFLAFPELRFAFIEAGSSWVPYVMEQSGAAAKGLSLADLQFYVTCEVSEDLDYLVSRIGDSNLMVGSDYGHADRAAVRDAHRRIMGRDDLDPASKERLTSSNARRLYGL